MTSPWVKYRCEGKTQKDQKGRYYMMNCRTKETLWMPDYIKRINAEKKKKKRPQPPPAPSQDLARIAAEYRQWRAALDPAVRAAREAEKKVEDIMHSLYLKNTTERGRLQNALKHAEADVAKDKALKPNPDFVKVFQQ